MTDPPASSEQSLTPEQPPAHGRSTATEQSESGRPESGRSTVPGRSEAAEAFVLRGVHVLDRTGRFGEPTDVAVGGGIIHAVGTRLGLDRDAVDVDAHDLWLMPGVVDCHAHVTQSTYDPFELATASLSTRVLQTAAALRASLAAGVTHLRDAGGADAGIRDAVSAGTVPGPRLAVSVVGLSRSGRHGDGAIIGPGLESAEDLLMPDYPGRPPHTVTEAGSLPASVRGILRAGADWIMIYASGGVMSARPGQPEPQFSPVELAAAVAEARRYGRPVMMHALGERSIEAAVAAGARSIEHGIGLTEPVAAAMAAAGVTLVPTLSPYQDLAALAATGVLPGWAADRAEATEAALAGTIAVARAAGVPIALGSDARHRTRHGANLAEISRLRHAGLTPPEALLAATATGARLFGLGEGAGRIAVGSAFDAILLDADPGDLSIFERPGAVSGVFLGGRAVLPHPRLPGKLVRPTMVMEEVPRIVPERPAVSPPG
ncbi:amidohydrolase, imidazolonepropionase [Frankia casuarinae]|uniref:Amidohydrolase n=2 Tax=Frankia casuarinae (strain DSM 45818 / CECT 9043 / HFP020203 / CcI3) TaxID=106370 RepID=Q2J8P3_FRACC|nr:amidohydrolase [Frankia casuarinae]ETA02385.1 amidohydrolase, imidazolonepropionase [Frankia sp. CcI6]OFB44822.1 amidohydrolase [Frankia sp. CgIM4]OHV55112.1 amidohydrolase [Frankia sp. CgIS1]TFE28742.1 amidohydrolase family protein [Frankia sp. B2]